MLGRQHQDGNLLRAGTAGVSWCWHRAIPRGYAPIYSSDRLTNPVPPLRPTVDVQPYPGDQQAMYVLVDRAGLEGAVPSLVVSPPVVLLASLLDGQRNLPAVRSAFALRTGVELGEQDLAGIVQRLDEANLLDSPRFRTLFEDQVARFRAAPERAATHAGGAYPAGSEELRSFLSAQYTHADGPGAMPSAPAGRVARGLIAPHIDLHRGGPTYAWTYRALAECAPAELYILLGTCHTPMSTPLAATRKAYATPLGSAPVDVDFLQRLAAEYGGDLYADEFSHRAEHSLEFQAVYLRYLNRVGVGGAAVVPLLCGSLPRWVGGSDPPSESGEIARVVSALRTALAGETRAVCLIAGADLAHVGPQFGDPALLTTGALADVARRDAVMLESICRGDADGFFRQVMADDDARRICGLAPIYYLLSLVGPGSGLVLRYSQWVDPRRLGSVSYAGVIFEESES